MGPLWRRCAKVRVDCAVVTMRKPPMIIIPGIRLAAAADARPHRRMSREYIEYGLGWSWTPQRVLKAIHDPATNVAVVHERGRLAGFRHHELRRAAGASGRCWASCAAHRQRGLGAALLAWLEKCALTAGLERIRLEARADNPGAMAFYEGQGYRPIGSVSRLLPRHVDAVRLEKRLRAPAAD